MEDGIENVTLFFYPEYDNIENAYLTVGDSDNNVLFRKQYNLLDLSKKE